MSNPLKRILVPVDFNVPSRAALSVANDLAGALGASIDVLHVIDLPDGLSMASEGYVPLPENYRQAVEKTRDRAAEGLAADDFGARECVAAHRRRQAGGRDRPLRRRPPRRPDRDGHARTTGVPHLVIGSVAESVVRGATARC